MRISDWSSDVCSSDLAERGVDASQLAGLRLETGKNVFGFLLETLDFLTDGSWQALAQLLLLSIDGVSERFLELVVANVGVDALVHRISHVADQLINLGFTGRFQAFFQGFNASLQLTLGPNRKGVV